MCAQELKQARAEAAQQQDRAGSGAEASFSGSGEDSDGGRDNREHRKKRGGKGKDRKEGRRTREERRKPRPDGKKAKKRGREDKAETKPVSFCAADCCVVQLQAGTLTQGACRSRAPAQTRLASTVSCARPTWTGVMHLRLCSSGHGLCLRTCLLLDMEWQGSNPTTSPHACAIAVL